MSRGNCPDIGAALEWIQFYEKGSQHGFTRGRSCLTNLLEFFKEVYESKDEGKLVDVICLDFANAFDKVPRKRLAKNLQAWRIKGQVGLLTSMQSWLSSRRQKVGIFNKYCSWIIADGVKWSTIRISAWANAIYNFFINDIDDGIVSKLSKSADGTKLCRALGDEEEVNKLRKDLAQNSAEHWGMRRKRINCEKTYEECSDGQGLADAI